MGSFTKGSVVLIKFPFSDLTKVKLRPALVLADASKNDFILCQITSKQYGDDKTVVLQTNDMRDDSLHKLSYVRYTKYLQQIVQSLFPNLVKLKTINFIL